MFFVKKLRCVNFVADCCRITVGGKNNNGVRESKVQTNVQIFPNKHYVRTSKHEGRLEAGWKRWEKNCRKRVDEKELESNKDDDDVENDDAVKRGPRGSV